MVVKFTTNLVDSSYLGCPIFIKIKEFYEMKQTKKLKTFSLFLQKIYDNILVEKSFIFFLKMVEIVWKEI